MEPSLHIVPTNKPTSASIQNTAGTLGLHDTLQYGPRNLATEIKTGHSLKSRADNWDETRDNLKLTMQRNIYGLHAPLRLLMERQIAAAGSHLPGTPQSNIHLDILMGRDELLETADVFGDAEGIAAVDFHRDAGPRHIS